MIHILVVDDHPAVREGTKLLLEQEGDISVVLAASEASARDMLEKQRFDVLLLDLHIADCNGIALAKQILSREPDTLILIFSGHEMDSRFNLMMEAGVAGFISKTASREQLVTAVRCALRGDVVLPLALVRQLRRPGASEQESGVQPEAPAVNEKEHDILQEIAKGKSNREIAQLHMMSQRSLEYALTGLFHKLKVKSRIEAAMKAKELGLLDDRQEGAGDPDPGLL
ncbi:DNA-binding response regulator [Paenibacillus sp. J31TS4]|uniref:response regulator transcription factor n=1 Tax=Paenibacillus sp. J31TS4 TaxID=2807195 RepID=UPI001B209E9A|nr:response regulator transcription factor [Paenibacillus sp. J31TS4]GIP37833.1 DNA-binding response regulator [Paenibacillus sp. J31TS4]